MKTKQLIILSLLMALLWDLDGQSSSMSLKLYSGFAVFQSSYNPKPIDYTIQGINFIGLSPAISFRNETRSLSHELEPKFRGRSWNDDSFEHSDLELGLRYEALWYLPAEIIDNLFFRLGGSFRFYYYRSESTPFDASFIPRITNVYGMELAGAGHIEYWLTKRLVLDLNMIVFNINSSRDTVILDNPILTERQRENQVLTIDTFNQRILRIGLGYKL